MMSGIAITTIFATVHTGSHQGPSAFCTVSIMPQASCALDGDGARQAVQTARGGMRRCDAHHARRHRRVDLRVQDGLAVALANADLAAVAERELLEERAMHARAGRPGGVVMATRVPLPSRAAISLEAGSTAARTCSEVSRSNPGSPSIEPRTRSTFQPGRVSPSGGTTPLKLCARPSQFTNVPDVSVN